jgi:uncharacterized membrane protein
MNVGLASQEQGRELKGPELKPQTVVVIHPPGAQFLITMWVSLVDPVRRTVSFYADEMKWGVLVSWDQDGRIHDDQGRTVKVYEYLGEV